MDLSKSYARRSFFIILTFMAFLMLVFDIGLYFGINWLLHILTPGTGAGANIQTVADFVKVFRIMSVKFVSWYIPFSALFFALLGLVLWIILKGSVSGILRDFESDSTGISHGKGKKSEKKDFADQRLEQNRKRRIFLCLLSVLQREGRLLDFFDEDLNLYEDEEIGAAVRSIQEDCKKTIAKYIAPKPIIDKEDGDEILIEPGFDPDSIKLVGNVTGEPPFKGILRHRGWKAGKNEIPRLADILDPSVIAPAEVEIE